MKEKSPTEQRAIPAIELEECFAAEKNDGIKALNPVASSKCAPLNKYLCEKPVTAKRSTLMYSMIAKERWVNALVSLREKEKATIK